MWIHPDQAKGGKAIGLPLSDEAEQLLRAQLGKSDEWVFPYKGRGRKEGAPIVKIKTAWQLAMERAGLGHFERKLDDEGRLISKKWIGDFTWHSLRHTWASWHVMAGTPLEVLQKLGGWEDLRMVMKYAHPILGVLVNRSSKRSSVTTSPHSLGVPVALPVFVG